LRAFNNLNFSIMEEIPENKVDSTNIEIRNKSSLTRSSPKRKMPIKWLGFIVLFALGYWIHGLVDIQQDKKEVATIATASQVMPEDVTSNEFDIFWETWNLVQEKYPFNDKEPGNKEKVYAATAGMVNAYGDPHTVFLSPPDTEIFEGDVRGEFGGVGMEVGMRDGVITVVAPLKDSPADKAGVMPGDIIYQVDSEDVYNKSVDEVVVLIRGEIKTPVLLGLVREGEDDLVELSIIRDTISIPVLDYELRDDNIFVISFYSFTRNAFSNFSEAMFELRQNAEQGKVKGLVIDLRSNPGGYLNVANDITSMFLPEGTPILREKGIKDEEKIYRSTGLRLMDENIPIVILVNGGSASASEILTGALSEYGRATVVGTQTFGKGSVQEFLRLRDGSSLKVTVAKWFTPDGVSIDDEGITPDVEVETTREDRENEKDPQLDKAIEILLEI